MRLLSDSRSNFVYADVTTTFLGSTSGVAVRDRTINRDTQDIAIVVRHVRKKRGMERQQEAEGLQTDTDEDIIWSLRTDVDAMKTIVKSLHNGDVVRDISSVTSGGDELCVADLEGKRVVAC